MFETKNAAALMKMELPAPNHVVPAPVSETSSAAEGAEEAPDVAEDKAKRPSQSAILVELAGSAHLFKTPDGEAFADVMINGHRETHALRRDSFRDHLARSFYLQEGRPPAAQAMADALSVLEGQAKYEGPTREVFVRVGHDGDRLYLDLGTEDWSVVEVDATGWRVLKDPPIRFRRPKGQLPMLVPIQGGRLDDLLSLMSIRLEDWPLLAGWLVMALHPHGPYPVLVLTGEQGTGKTSAATMLKVLIDPSRAPLRSEPREIRDLMIAANNGWLLGFDNLSHISAGLSDAMCRLSTGGGFAVRAHFENADEALFEATRPMLFNGIDDLATRSDLLDRCVIIETQRIDEASRRTKAEIDTEFERLRPQVLGALLDGVVSALKHRDSVVLERTPRMADFAVWGTAAEAGLGLATGSFMTAYMGNRAGSNSSIIDASPVARAVDYLLVCENGYWRGTATELYAKLSALLDEVTRRALPKNPKTLSDALKRLAPNLRAVGINVHQPPRGNRREWVLEKTRISASVASVATAAPEEPTEVRVPAPTRMPSKADAVIAPIGGVEVEPKPALAASTFSTVAADAANPCFSNEGGWTEEDV